jgi:hypothetical protein
MSLILSGMAMIILIMACDDGCVFVRGEAELLTVALGA